MKMSKSKPVLSKKGKKAATAAAIPAADDWDATPVSDVSGEVEDWGKAHPAQKELPELTIETHSGEFDPSTAKILIYGESGVGKTRFASTFPSVIFADVDQGMSSVTNRVARVGIDQFIQMESLYQFLLAGEHEYETVVIDTLNELQRVAMHATIEDFPSIRRAYDNLPSQSDYGKMIHEFIELTLKFIKLPMRVVLLAQVNSRQFDTDVLMPQLVGKNSAREICRKMDVIGYIYKSGTEDSDHHKLPEICFDSMQYVTKDRSFKLPTVVTEPDFDSIAANWD
jgi:hypothetical protein